jgi:hypothetical protein
MFKALEVMLAVAKWHNSRLVVMFCTNCTFWIMRLI